MKGKLLFVIVLLLCLAGLLAACGQQQATEYTITEPYQYPIVPETAEWRELKGLDAKIEACEVPEEILENITTEALFQTVLDYPLLINFIVYGNPGDLMKGYRAGFEAILGYCNALQELVERPETQELAEQFQKTEECQERALYRDFTIALLDYLQEKS